MAVEGQRNGCSADRVIRELVARLRTRPDEMLTATQGRAVRVQVTVTGQHSESFRIMVTATGAVALLEPQNLVGEDFRPQMVLAGTAEELVAVATGEIPWRTAIDLGTVVPYVDPGDVEALRALVAAVLNDLLVERP